MQHAKGQECKADQGSHRQDNGQADIHPNQTQEKVFEEAKKKTYSGSDRVEGASP